MEEENVLSFQFITILSFVAVASAGLLPLQQEYHAAPVVPTTTVVKTVAPVAYAHAKPVLVKHEAHYDDHPQYNYNYDVNDEHTGDVHSQTEERDGDVVRGEYSLIDADGFRRVVQYTVDPHSGFNAIVNRYPLDHVKTVVKQVAPITLVKQYPQPQAYHQHH
ncbi:larval cuticle protein A2B-like [Musca domestica]|uniref:Larval cuticle protein A2B-like n=1 Tax=Musca domestica TaxID=7370 RepID=A0ABM3VFN1_MUSDO|nr:larval cuticle protein A2B-like [Musca domestica]